MSSPSLSLAVAVRSALPRLRAGRQLSEAELDDLEYRTDEAMTACAVSANDTRRGRDAAIVAFAAAWCARDSDRDAAKRLDIVVRRYGAGAGWKRDRHHVGPPRHLKGTPEATAWEILSLGGLPADRQIREILAKSRR